MDGHNSWAQCKLVGANTAIAAGTNGPALRFFRTKKV
jgi:hypothetical protein